MLNCVFKLELCGGRLDSLEAVSFVELSMIQKWTKNDLSQNRY